MEIFQHVVFVGRMTWPSLISLILVAIFTAILVRTGHTKRVHAIYVVPIAIPIKDP
jgi:hypothetical protein